MITVEVYEKNYGTEDVPLMKTHIKKTKVMKQPPTVEVVIFDRTVTNLDKEAYPEAFESKKEIKKKK